MDKTFIHPELRKIFSRLPNMTIASESKLWVYHILMNKMARLGYKPDDQVEMTVHKLTLAPSVCPSSYHAPSAAWL